MDIYIHDDTQLHTLQTSLGVERHTITATLLTLQTLYAHYEELRVHIDKELVAESYKYNPSLMAGKTKNSECFSRARGHFDGDCIMLVYTNSGDPVSFTRKVAHHVMLKDHNEWLTVPWSEVPTTYTHKPELLRYRIKQLTGLKIVTHKTLAAMKVRRAAPSQQSPAIQAKLFQDIDHDQELN